MDKKLIASELIKMAKDLISEDDGKQKVGLKGQIRRFLDENEEAIKQDEYANARMKLTGPKDDTVWMNVGLADLEAIMKVLK